ncbi:hypothetical protein BDW62DRAFT_209236 [Aspergillus aurantiobrunneus]
MAPVYYRPPPTSLIRPSLIAPPISPVQATSFIPRKLFLQLIAGTFCIFILTVLIWKVPRFLRSFTKARIFREGNATSARYAKTWYGWVPSQQNEASQRVSRNCMARLRNWTAWSSSKTDLEWVWWDPGQKELGTYQERGKRRANWARHHSLRATDAMWNHSSPTSSNRRTINGLRTESPPFAVGALPPSDAPRPMTTPIRGPTPTHIPLQEDPEGKYFWGYSTVPCWHRAKVSKGFRSNTSPHTVPHIRKTLASYPPSPFTRGLSHVPLRFMTYTQSSSHSFSMPNLSQHKRLRMHSYVCSNTTSRSRNDESEASISDNPAFFLRSRKYQVWSARMGLQTLKCIGYNNHTLPTGPPGSPKSAVLGSLSVDSTPFERAFQCQQSPKWTSSSDISDLFLYGNQQQCNIRHPMSVNEYKGEANVPKKSHSLPMSRSHLTHFRRPTLLTWNEDSTGTRQASSERAQTQRKKPNRRLHKRSGTGIPSPFMIQAKNWSNWEIRFLYSLNSRLDWVSNQLTPGQRPFHFALLANHWLNRETWIVYDPVSRIDTDKRRCWGDPRFNVPYPAPTSNPTPKYPKSKHRPIYTPKINSWRVQVNRHRKTLGLTPFSKRIELYDSSADDPPDGKIDPASWVLRRPPQGFSLSARQKERYYESGTGWQEKLSDWQKIKRGYRIRKAIYEGRVNRTRAKEIVYGMTRYYRQATSRILQSDAPRCEEENEELSVDEPL